MDKNFVIAVHNEIIALYGGLAGMRDEGLLESALGRYNSVLSYGEGSDIFDAVAAMTHSLIKNHAFADGNKRTAANICEAQLEADGYSLRVNDDEFYAVIMGIAQDKISVEEFARWLRMKCEE